MSLKAQALPSSRQFKTLIVLFVLTLPPLVTITVQGGAQTAAADPGPRRGSAGAGGAFQGLSGGPGLNTAERTLFNQAFLWFLKVESVSGTISGESGVGLGPAFNGNSCKVCQAQPAIGGSSPGRKSPQNSVDNPQVALVTLDGATNTVPTLSPSTVPCARRGSS